MEYKAYNTMIDLAEQGRPISETSVQNAVRAFVQQFADVALTGEVQENLLSDASSVNPDALQRLTLHYHTDIDLGYTYIDIDLSRIKRKPEPVIIPDDTLVRKEINRILIEKRENPIYEDKRPNPKWEYSDEPGMDGIKVIGRLKYDEPELYSIIEKLPQEIIDPTEIRLRDFVLTDPLTTLYKVMSEYLSRVFRGGLVGVERCPLSGYALYASKVLDTRVLELEAAGMIAVSPKQKFVSEWKTCQKLSESLDQNRVLPTNYWLHWQR